MNKLLIITFQGVLTAAIIAAFIMFWTETRIIAVLDRIELQFLDHDHPEHYHKLEKEIK